MLPDFLHIGAAKCASSWLWTVCKEHPEIYVPETPDNVNFFTVRYHKGLEWYRKTYFAEYGGEKTAGEFSNSYMCYGPAIRRLASDLPDVRLTMCLRNPVIRIFLQWAHENLKGPNAGDPSRRRPLAFTLHHHGHGFFRMWADPGFYARHLRTIYEHFPKEKVFVMIYDDLRADPAGFLAAFFDFLEVDTRFRPSILHTEINPDAPGSDPDRDFDPKLRAEFYEVYRQDITELEGLLGRDLSGWR
jgi:hypothetical protein